MWVKTTCCNSSLSYFKLETSFTMYWCSPLPVRRLQPAESYNSLSFSSSPGRELQPPLALALAKILVRRCWPTEGYNLLFLPETTFHKFSDQIHEHQSIIKNFSINQSPFHQLDLNQVDTSLTAIPKTQYQKPYSRNRTQNPAAISRNSQITA